MDVQVSVIIPTYNPGQYFKDCLDSIRNQSIPYSIYEVIIVLNGCREGFEEPILNYINNYPQVNLVYLFSPVPGVSRARNIGIDNAKGRFITFIDDDDFVSPTYLEELFEHASPSMISLCYPLSFLDGTDEYKPFYITRDYIKNKDDCPCNYKKARKFFSGPVYKMIHRDIIGDRRFDERFENGEDSLFMFEISDLYELVDFTSENAIYFRRIRKGSALLRKKSGEEIWRNCIRMILSYSSIYFQHPLKYSFGFFLTRVLGAIHGAMEQFNLQNE